MCTWKHRIQGTCGFRCALPISKWKPESGQEGLGNAFASMGNAVRSVVTGGAFFVAGAWLDTMRAGPKRVVGLHHRVSRLKVRYRLPQRIWEFPKHQGS